MNKYQDIAMMLEANAITNTVDAYELGRADMKREIEEHSVFYSTKPIEDIVREARADAIDEVLEIIRDCFGHSTSEMIRRVEDLKEQSK